MVHSSPVVRVEIKPASERALLYGQVADSIHEFLRGARPGLKIGGPVFGTRGENDLVTVLADEYFGDGELEFFGQTNGLAAVVHEDSGSALRGLLSRHIHSYTAGTIGYNSEVCAIRWKRLLCERVEERCERDHI